MKTIQKSLSFLFYIVGLSYMCNNLNAIENKLGSYEKYWIQHSNNGKLLFRHITQDTNKQCPSIVVDDKELSSLERENKYRTEFPIKVCQAVIENGSKPHTIKYKNMNIKTKIDSFSKISVVGDTGCIVDNGLEQGCKIEGEYPFLKVAQNIKNDEADLIIHVGDYFYSKSKCNNPACGKIDDKNRPYDDNFETWRADFIDSGSQFFNTAPIIFTRGNHESCERGGKGWSVLLDPSEKFKKCEKHNKPYSVEMKNLRFLVIDSAYAIDSESGTKKIDKKKYDKLVEKYKKNFDALAKKIDNKKQNVLVSHKALFSKEQRGWISDEIYDLNYTLQEAIKNSDFKNKLLSLDLILSGHTHTALLIDLNTNSSSNKNLYQIVSGNGGAKLYKQPLFIKEHSSSDTLNTKDLDKQTEKINENSSQYKIFEADIKSVYRHKEFGHSNLFFDKNGLINAVGFYDWKNEELSRKPLEFRG